MLLSEDEMFLINISTGFCVYNSPLMRFIPKKFVGIVLFGKIHLRYCKSEMIYGKLWLLNHEMIHIFQIKREGAFKFYFKYIFYFFKNLIKYKNFETAYNKIPYEEEAYRNDTRFDYIPKAYYDVLF